MMLQGPTCHASVSYAACGGAENKVMVFGALYMSQLPCRLMAVAAARDATQSVSVCVHVCVCACLCVVRMCVYERHRRLELAFLWVDGGGALPRRRRLCRCGVRSVDDGQNNYILTNKHTNTIRVSRTGQHTHRAYAEAVEGGSLETVVLNNTNTG